ncbi:MAG: ribulose-phosphate 3-epimerase [Candidatus Omnitrophica bacterium]|nr:ribulose-phosphate 3-epimerase [Candidatus Omnitrophota bacterium]
MMIVPAILTSEPAEFKKMLKICKSFTDYVQIDIMDGIFVPSKSILPDTIEKTKTTLKSEAHLMVKNPLLWLEAFKKFGASRIIFHFEAVNNPVKVIKEIKNYGFEVGLAINPDTKISDFKHLVEKVTTVLFMSVNPGFYGSKFIPIVCEKIKKFKKLYPKKIVGIDGGIKFDNISKVISTNVEYICVGSAIFLSDNPRQAYLKLKEQLKEKKE